MYALVEFLGKQFKVEPGAEIKVPKVSQEIGDSVSLEKVLYLNEDGSRSIGQPYVKDATIDASVVRHGRDRKIIVFKMKRRKGYQRRNGHRQDFSVLKIDRFNFTSEN